MRETKPVRAAMERSDQLEQFPEAVAVADQQFVDFLTYSEDERSKFIEVSLNVEERFPIRTVKGVEMIGKGVGGTFGDFDKAA